MGQSLGSFTAVVLIFILFGLLLHITFFGGWQNTITSLSQSYNDLMEKLWLWRRTRNAPDDIESTAGVSTFASPSGDQTNNEEDVRRTILELNWSGIHGYAPNDPSNRRLLAHRMNSGSSIPGTSSVRQRGGGFVQQHVLTSRV